MIYWKPHSRVQRKKTKQNNKHHCQGMTNKTNYGSVKLSHMQKLDNKQDNDPTKYIWTISEEVIRQGQGLYLRCLSLNLFQNTAIFKLDTRC